MPQAATVEDVRQAQELLRIVTEEPLGAGGAFQNAAPAMRLQPAATAAEGENVHVAQQRRDMYHPASGTFTHLECSEGGPRMHLMAGGKKPVFLMDCPDSVLIKSVTGGVFDLTCGPQKARAKGMPAGVTGLVRGLDLK